MRIIMKLFLILVFVLSFDSCVTSQYSYLDSNSNTVQNSSESVQQEKDAYPSDSILVSASDNRIIYSGRFDFSDKKSPRFDWPGVSMKISFKGTGCGAILEDGGNDYNVILNGKMHSKIVTSPGKSFYKLAENLENIDNTIELVKRNEASFGIATFKGFVLPKGSEAVEQPVTSSPKRKIEFIGDSITCGYGNEGFSVKCPELRSYQNNYLAYGPLTARALDAEYHITAISGKGVVRNYGDPKTFSPDPFPTYYDQSLVGDKSIRWDSKNWIPDVVVIALGVNDFSTQPYPEKASFMSAYKAFVKKIRSYYPHAEVFCVVTRTTYSALDEYVSALVDQLVKEGDTRISLVKFPNADGSGSGCDYHPNVMAHQEFSDFITSLIKQRMEW